MLLYVHCIRVIDKREYSHEMYYILQQLICRLIELSIIEYYNHDLCTYTYRYCIMTKSLTGCVV